MRIYLNLTNGYEHLRDHDGLEVANDQAARREVMKSLKELRQEQTSSAADWEGWELHIVNDIGTLLFSVDLSSEPSEHVYSHRLPSEVAYRMC
jgi:hypothetical protein